jgi:Flagellar C1a complex subunit C1a-32
MQQAADCLLVLERHDLPSTAARMFTTGCPRAVVDLYKSVIRFCNSQQMGGDAFRILLAIVRKVHTDAVAEKHTVDMAYERFAQLMLQHSVNRPPKAVGIFSYQQMRATTAWFTQSYMLHFPLYQHVFAESLSLSFTAIDPRTLIERPAALPPLDIAATEEQRRAELDAQAEAQKLEELRKAEEVGSHLHVIDST